MTVTYTIFLLSLITYASVLGLQEGDFCNNPNGDIGVCKQTENCNGIQKLLTSGIRPTICGFPIFGNYPIVCCPPDEAVKPLRTSNSNEISYSLANKKCHEYAQTVEEIMQDPVLVASPSSSKINHCGIIAETLILGGVDAKPKEFPHMALIGYKEPPEWLCGGSLISRRFVLSAAHCSVPKRKGRAKWVKLGELDTSIDCEDSDPVIFKIIEIIDHPQYNASTLYNDLALYKLENEVNLNPYIRPICLPTVPEITAEYVIASGWGHTEWGGAPSTNLMKVDLQLVSNRECNEKFSETIARGKQIPQGILQHSMICAGREKGKDTCQGDSGGPLQITLSQPYCMYSIIGVTSFGKGCGLGFPGVYTRVYHYVPWIVQTIWPDK